MGYLGDLLIKALGGAQIRPPKRFKCWGDLPQCAAVYYLLGRYKLCLGQREVLLAKPSEQCAEVKPALAPPGEPKIYIDLGLWGIHTEAEKNELVEQIAASIAAVRRQLFDSNLAVARTPREFLEEFGRMMRGMKHAVIMTGDPPPADAVMLDPEGPCALDEELVRSRRAFAVGGVVDKERAYKGASALLAESAGIMRRCRIELKGSIVGVPDRINKVIEILLAVRFAGLALEDAIIAAQAKRDKVYRLMRELMRLAEGGAVPVDEAEELARWLKADEKILRLAAEKAHVRLV